MTGLSANDFEFPQEFANFVNYVGANDVHKAVRKVTHKLAQFDNAPRRLFGTRYFFHEEIEQFSDGSRPFQLDMSRPLSVRAASFIAGVNRARRTMSDLGLVRFRKMILDNLKPDRDFRQIEHEIRCYIHLRQKQAEVTFADLDKIGNFDFLCTQELRSVEVECKTISEDTGNPIKNELVVNLSQLFLRLVRNDASVAEPGIFLIRFKTDPRASNTVMRALQLTVGASPVSPINDQDITVEFLPRPDWRSELLQTPVGQFDPVNDPEIAGRAHCITQFRGNLFALAMVSDRANSLSERVTQVLKIAADQLSAQRPSIVWLHFVGFSEQQFRELAEFSMDGKGNGLNALVASVLYSRSLKDRSHINIVRFSAEPESIIRRPMLSDELILTRAASIDGIAYDVPNPRARFAQSRLDL